MFVGTQKSEVYNIKQKIEISAYKMDIMRSAQPMRRCYLKTVFMARG